MLDRKYYLAVPPNTTAANPRIQMDDRLEVGTLVDNVKVADDIKWKMTLSK